MISANGRIATGLSPRRHSPRSWSGRARHRTVGAERAPDAIAADQLGRTGGLADANARLERAGVERIMFSWVDGGSDGEAEGRATSVDVHTGARRTIACDLVTDWSARLPDDPSWAGDLPRAGDCVAPGRSPRRFARVAALRSRSGGPGPAGRPGNSLTR